MDQEMQKSKKDEIVNGVNVAIATQRFSCRYRCNTQGQEYPGGQPHEAKIKER